MMMMIGLVRGGPLVMLLVLRIIRLGLVSCLRLLDPWLRVLVSAIHITRRLRAAVGGGPD